MIKLSKRTIRKTNRSIYNHIEQIKLLKHIKPLLNKFHKILHHVLSYKHTRAIAIVTIPLVVIISGLTIYLKTKKPSPPVAPKLTQSNAFQSSLYHASNSEYSVNIGNKKTKTPTVTFAAAKNKIDFTLKDAKPSDPIVSDQQLTYKNVVDGIDLQYTTLPQGLKEDLILNQKPDSDVFIFDLNLHDATPEKILNNFSAPVFFDKKGNYLFHFDKPYAIDAVGNRTDAVTLQIEKQNDQYIARLSVSSTWLFDPNRVYPIRIDPTVTHDETSEFATGYFNRSKDTGSTTNPSLESYYQERLLDQYTIGLWHLNETAEDSCTSGKDACDSSGRSNDGTATGTTINTTTPLMGAANRYFGGSSSHILTVADTTDLTFGTGDFTVSLWVNPSVITGNYEGIMGTYNGSSGFMITTSYGTDGHIAYWNTTNGWVDTNVSLALNTWQHLAVTRESGTVRIYLNGEIINTTESWTGSIDGTNLIIGGWSASYAYFTGYMDEIMISKGIARNQTDIQALTKHPPSSTYTSPVLDLTSPISLDSISWDERGVATGDGETASSSADLVGQWNFNETSGTTANNDAEGTSCGGTPANCDGTLTGFATTTSQDAAVMSGWTANNRRWGAGGLMFDGSDDYVDLGTDNSLNITSSFTIEAYIKQSATSGVVTRIVEKDYSVSYLFGVTTANALDLYIENAERAQTIANVIQPGIWHHVAAVFDDIANTVKIYVDGKEAALASGGTYSGTITGSARSVKVGKYWGDSTHSFKGVIDSVRIYSRALPAHEILSNANIANVELQTRTSADNLTWEDWRPTQTDTVINSLDSDSTNWALDGTGTYMPYSKSDSTTIKATGSGALKFTLSDPLTDSNTKLLYKFNDTNPSLSPSVDIFDTTANNHDGSMYGSNISTGIVEGIEGKARSFNGTDDNIQITDSDDFYLSGDFSIDFWYKDNSSADDTAILSFGNSSSAYESAVIYLTSGTLYFSSATSSVGPFNVANALSMGATSTTQYDHFAVVRSGSNFYTYKNGVQVSTVVDADVPYNANLVYIGARPGYTSKYLNGKLDNLRITKGSALSVESLAETYRNGSSHTLTRTISSTNLSSAIALPFYIAADRPGNYLTLNYSEAAFQNYEIDANTIGFWHLNELAGTGAYLQDASTSNIDGTPTGTTFASGKIGGARQFVAGDDISLGSQSIVDNIADITIDAWVFPTTQAATHYRVFSENLVLYVGQYSTQASFYMGTAGAWTIQDTTCGYLPIDQWSHVAWVKSGTSYYVYINGILTESGTGAPATLGTASTVDYISTYDGTTQPWLGKLDEVRISNTVRTADQIRQAYEIGLRTHPITIDFKADLSASNLITGSADTSFTLTSTSYGTKNTLEHLAVDDKIIIKEKYSDTEYSAQGVVTSVNSTTGAVTVSSWDSGSTFPASGFTAYATVFKWQLEYLNLLPALSTHRDAATLISLRPTNGYSGSNVYLDDLRSTTGYLSTPSNSIPTSTNARYFQYRIINNLTNSQTSPQTRSVSLTYTSNSAPSTPAVNTSYLQESLRTTDSTPTIRFSSTDTESDDIVYQVAWYTDSDFGAALNATSSADVGFANITTPADTSPFNASDTISYTFPTLSNNTYYYRVRAINAFTGVYQYSSWSPTKSFTVATSNGFNDWHQTEADQFVINTITNDNPVGSLTADNTNETIYQGSGDYTYALPITITNASTPLTDYDVLIQLDTSTLINNSKMQSDCDDILFYDSDKVTLLSFWLEQGCNTTSTQIWVRLPSIPYGDRTIYIAYGNPSATSSSQSWSGNYIIMSNTSCASGWTRFSALDAKLPRGNSTYGGTGGSSTHTHTGSGTTGYSSSNHSTEGGGVSTPSQWNHTHQFSFTSNTSSNYPAYMEVYYCSKTAPINNFDNSYIIIYDTLPSGWSNYSSINGYFGYGANGYGSTGGSDTHTNTVNNGTTFNYSTPYTAQYGGYDQRFNEGHNHTHTTTFSESSTLPPYIEYIPATVDSGTLPFGSGALSYFDTTPPYGWTRVSSLDSNFVRLNSTSGSTGGNSTHSHSYSVTALAVGGGNQMNGNGGGSFALNTHTHSGSGTSSTADHTPPYLDVLIHQRNTNSEISLVYGSESSQYSGSILTSSITASAINATASNWKQLSFTDNEGDGDIKYQIYYDVTGTPTIVPDGALAGNSTGFDTSPINLTGLTTASYPILYLKANFTTTSISNYPTLSDWTLSIKSYPSAPSLDEPTDDAVVTTATPILKTTATDLDGDYIQYQIILCENAAMTLNCQTFDQSISQTGWKYQNTQGGTAYLSGIQGWYTIQTPLVDRTTYYWKSRAIDPGDTNTWGPTQTTPYSFTYYRIPTSPNSCSLEESVLNNSIVLTWADASDNESGFTIQRNLDGAGFSNFYSPAVGATSYNDATVGTNHTYQYRIHANNYSVSSDWCTSSILTIGSDPPQNMEFEGIKMEGVKIQ